MIKHIAVLPINHTILRCLQSSSKLSLLLKCRKIIHVKNQLYVFNKPFCFAYKNYNYEFFFFSLLYHLTIIVQTITTNKTMSYSYFFKRNLIYGLGQTYYYLFFFLTRKQTQTQLNTFS